jgi:hypothetical protein
METKRYSECINDAERRRWLAENSEPNERDVTQVDLLRTSLASAEKTVKGLREAFADSAYRITMLNGCVSNQLKTIRELQARIVELEATK